MGIENMSPEKPSRREFLKFAGAAVASGVMKSAVPRVVREAMTKTESLLEDTPDEEGIRQTFDVLQGERLCHERRKESDELGVYLWEIEFEIEGGTAEFGYMRKGRHKVGGSALTTKIYITFFDESGMPEGGHDVAKYVEGKWVYIP